MKIENKVMAYLKKYEKIQAIVIKHSSKKLESEIAMIKIKEIIAK